MVNIDEKFKDASPVETVSNIQSILKNAGVSVTEKWKESGLSDCFSLSVTIDGTGLSTNGKGVTKELARASGYAELMERLQSCSLAPVEEHVFSDGKFVSKDELSRDSAYVFEAIAASMSELSDKKISADKLIQKSISISGDSNRVFAMPYYDVINKKYVYLPCGFIPKAYSTNGLAAGNSIEEAIVQGFSEIVERYSLKIIFKNKLTPPTVPEDMLKEYKTAYRIITQIKEAGFDVMIKDCSLGNGYPVIAAVFLNRKTHSYHVNFGSSPVFEIALERSLTETFQGVYVDSAAKVRKLVSDGNKQSLLRSMNKARKTGDGAYPCEFFLNKSSYPLICPKAHENGDNAELLTEVLAYVKKMNCSLLVRDMSHFGFNTYSVIAPGISEAYYYLDTFTTDFPYYEISREVEKARKDLTKSTSDQISMLRVIYNFVKQTNVMDVSYSILAKMPVASGEADVFLGYMFLAYVEWECKNMQGVSNYIKSAIAIAPKEYDSAYLSCVVRIQELLAKGYLLDDIFSILNNFYESDVIENLKEVYSNQKNPFLKFIVNCDPDKCFECKYQSTCMLKARKALANKVNDYVRAFDNKAAFEKICQTFEKADA